MKQLSKALQTLASPQKTTQLIINTLQGRKRENVKLFLLISCHLYPNFDKHTPLIINQKTIIIMKRFFIFAAMLLSLTMGAFVLPDEPPLILPGTGDFVTTPTNMHDIDRSIPRCIYTYIPERGTIDFYCEGIGNADFYVVDQNGCTFEIELFCDFSPSHASAGAFPFPLQILCPERVFRLL